MAALTSAAEVADLHLALVALCNRVLSADRVSPGDDPAVAGVLGRVAATLDLAVEFLSRGDDAAGVAAVRRVPLTKLFRLGVSLVGKLHRLARSLVRQSPFAALRPAVELWEPEDAEVLAALTRLRPLFPRLLDNPPTAGERPFGSLHDLATATAAVERAAAALALVVGLGVRPEDISPERLGVMGVADPAVLDTGLLARTLLVQRLLGRAPGPIEPLPAAAISSFKEQFNSSPQHIEIMAKSAATILRSVAPGGVVHDRHRGCRRPLAARPRAARTSPDFRQVRPRTEIATPASSLDTDSRAAVRGSATRSPGAGKPGIKSRLVRFWRRGRIRLRLNNSMRIKCQS